MRKTIFFIFYAVNFLTILRGQNLVVNPSFESSNESGVSIPPGEFSLSKAKGWNTPTRAQATLYSSIPTLATTNRAMNRWRFTAKEGNNVIGIMTYGNVLDDDKNELREYAQGSLIKPLTVGQKYYVSYWVHFHCEGTNNLGVAFLTTPLSIDAINRLTLKPEINHSGIIRYSNTSTWYQVRDSFIAREPFQYFIIGNFLSNIETAIEADKYRYHKAYLDDIIIQEAVNDKMPIRTFDWALENEKNIKKEIPTKPETISPTKSASNLSDITPTVAEVSKEKTVGNESKTGILKGEVLVLDKVLFQFNSAVLESTSTTQLNKLVAYLQRNTMMKILVKGHTSSEGSDEYNQKLSENRAKAVVDYLKSKGIEDSRLSFKGFGKSQPIINNDKESSRQLNRRVEFEVLE